jgi:phosphoribosylformimino-5-aminoimidazole carboxamide ribonucleotide (ProFAR) isomerase
VIIPCIDLMKGKVVQLVQGRDKVLEAKSPDETLAMFTGFPQIQVIDLDAAMGKGSNDAIVAHLASRATVRVGGGVRTVERAHQLVSQGAFRVIVGTSALSPEEWTATDLIPELEPYCSGFLCTYVDKEGMMKGTDLAWFENLRKTTEHELVAAGGITTREEIEELISMNIRCAIGMAIYTGRFRLEDLRDFVT